MEQINLLLGKLSPKAKQMLLIASIFGGLIILVATLGPEPRKIKLGEKRAIEHLLTDEDTDKITMQHITAQMDNLKNDNSKLQAQLDTLYADIKRGDFGGEGGNSAASKLNTKTVNDLKTVIKTLERKSSLLQKRIDTLEDSKLAMSNEALKAAVREAAGDLAPVTSADGFPIMPMTPVSTGSPMGTGSTGSTPAPHIEFKPIEAPNGTPIDPVETPLEVHKNASDFFKSAPTPSKPVSARSESGDVAGVGRSGKQLVGRSISAADTSSSSIAAKEREVKRVREAEANAGKDKEETIYLPQGTILEAVTLSGIDASTSNEAKSSPTPSLFKIKDLAVLPNNFTADLVDCFLLASGYGSISSHRVMLRAEGISCVNNDGSVVEARLDAYATGLDGRAGIRGKLVHKNQELMAKSLMAGFLDGIAQAMTPRRVQSLNTSSDGNVAFESALTEQGLQAGLMGGASTAAGKIADRWLELADAIQPIIELPPGVPVSFIFTRGVKLPVKAGKRDLN